MRSTMDPSDRHPKIRTSGFTLAEVIVATTLSAMILAGLTSSYVFFVKSSVGMSNYVDMNMQTRRALEMFGRDVRATRTVNTMTATTFSATTLTLTGTETIVWAFNSGAKTLTRQVGGGAAIAILNDVDSLTFKYYNTVGAITASVSEARKVQIDAEMLRTVIAIKNTNQVVSARFTMRNRNVST